MPYEKRKRKLYSGVHGAERIGRARKRVEHNRRTQLQYARASFPSDEKPEMELLFLINSNPKLQSLIKEYKERLFSLHWDEIQMLRITLINIKKEQECSHSNQSQTPK